MLEAALALRNVDSKEALQIAKAWGNVKAIIIKDPRVSKARLRLTELRQAIPELFDKDHPWEGPPCIVVHERSSHHCDEQRKLCEELELLRVPSLTSALVRGFLKRPSRLIWDHHGVCHCGKRTCLFSQCKERKA